MQIFSTKCKPTESSGILKELKEHEQGEFIPGMQHVRISQYNTNTVIKRRIIVHNPHNKKKRKKI